VEPGAFTTNVVAAASTTQTTIADYDGLREKARERLHGSLRNGADPDKAASLIVKIAHACSPRARYGAGREALLIPRVTTLLPQWLVGCLLRRSFGKSARYRG
jgi:hypothetical protein